MSYATPHSIMRFIERVDINLPRKKKQRDKIINNYLKKAYNKLKKIVGTDKFLELTCTNPTKILNNQEVLGNLEYLIKEEKK